ncbi:hypothetical protein NOVO_00795 [Rickettsiales bacterium Ac37b]|nr:hypothetical protein NOVO_00795 [Rickettsiales bacterium Ac37b]
MRTPTDHSSHKRNNRVENVYQLLSLMGKVRKIFVVDVQRYRMSITNKFPNSWHYLGLGLHLDQDYKVKPMQEYKQVISDTYDEYITLLKNGQDRLFIKACITLGQILSDNIPLYNSYQELSPIDCYHDRWYLKIQKEFKEDFKDYLATVYVQREYVVDHDDSSYLEQVFKNASEGIICFVDLKDFSPDSLNEIKEKILNLGSAVSHGASATSYSVTGISTLGLNIASFGYNICQYIVFSKRVETITEPIYAQYNSTLNHHDDLNELPLIGTFQYKAITKSLIFAVEDSENNITILSLAFMPNIDYYKIFIDSAYKALLFDILPSKIVVGIDVKSSISLFMGSVMGYIMGDLTRESENEYIQLIRYPSVALGGIIKYMIINIRDTIGIAEIIWVL